MSKWSGGGVKVIRTYSSIIISGATNAFWGNTSVPAAQDNTPGGSAALTFCPRYSRRETHLARHHLSSPQQIVLNGQHTTSPQHTVLFLTEKVKGIRAAEGGADASWDFSSRKHSTVILLKVVYMVSTDPIGR